MRAGANVAGGARGSGARGGAAGDMRAVALGARGVAGGARGVAGGVREVFGQGDVADLQRSRMVAAMVDAVAERGVAQATVAHVVARSGVSRRTFYELFEDRDACFLAAFEEAVVRAAVRVAPAWERAAGWREGIAAGLQALLEFLDDEPRLGALCLIDALGAGPAALERRREVLELLVDAVDAGRGHARGSLRPTRMIAEGAVGAVLGVLHARLTEDRRVGSGGPGPRARDARAGRAPNGHGGARVGVRAGGGGTMRGPSMLELQGSLMAMIVLPYLGPAAAARELARPAPERVSAAPAPREPLRDLDMRLTYRTVRVLLSVADHPGASNREVAEASGVHDRGQISKLLARLEHLGLVRNRDGYPIRGEPNDWRLTPRGQAIERTIRDRTTPAGP